jgi:hypothetical protein
VISTTDKPCLVIPDVHGHHDRLNSLLLQEGIIDAKDKRINHDVEVIQLGDLGHFGADHNTGDRLNYMAVNLDNWIDHVLWGNHDYAVMDSRSLFGGYCRPEDMLIKTMNDLIDREVIKYAFAAHGFLMTHAGLHAKFKHQNVADDIKEDPVKFAEWINKEQDDENWLATVIAVGSSRGGRSPAGGILWRDANESLYDGFRQVFGHTSKDKVRKYQTPNGYSYCIDTGNQFNGELKGIWLPEERIVGVKI